MMLTRMQTRLIALRIRGVMRMLLLLLLWLLRRMRGNVRVADAHTSAGLVAVAVAAVVGPLAAGNVSSLRGCFPLSLLQDLSLFLALVLGGRGDGRRQCSLLGLARPCVSLCARRAHGRWGHVRKHSTQERLAASTVLLELTERAAAAARLGVGSVGVGAVARRASLWLGRAKRVTLFAHSTIQTNIKQHDEKASVERVGVVGRPLRAGQWRTH